MDWTTTTCMAMGYLFFVAIVFASVITQSYQIQGHPMTHKLLYKSFWWHTHPWFNASPLPSELQPKNWKPNHTPISNNTQNAQICKTKHPPHIFLVPHNFFMHLCLDSNLVGSAIESCTYLHPPNIWTWIYS